MHYFILVLTGLIYASQLPVCSISLILSFIFSIFGSFLTNFKWRCTTDIWVLEWTLSVSHEQSQRVYKNPWFGEKELDIWLFREKILLFFIHLNCGYEKLPHWSESGFSHSRKMCEGLIVVINTEQIRQTWFKFLHCYLLVGVKIGSDSLVFSG